MPSTNAAHRRVVPILVTAWFSLAPPALASAREGSRFGDAGGVLVMGAFQVQNASPSSGPSLTALELSPGVRFFPVSRLALGADLQLTTLWLSGRSQTALNVVPTIGVVLPITTSVSLLPQFEASLNVIDSPSIVGSGSTTASKFGIGGYLPVIVHPPGHFFFGIGPELLVDLTSSSIIAKSTTIGVRTVIGGWF